MPEIGTVESTIRAEMARRGIFQKDIASVLGISVAGVSERLKGRTRISVEELLRIAKRLDVPVESLLPTEAASSPTGDAA